MALIKRLIERRKIRRTAEQSLAQNPIFSGRPVAAYHSVPPEVNGAPLNAESAGPEPTPATVNAAAEISTVGAEPPPQVAISPASTVAIEGLSGGTDRPAARAASSTAVHHKSPETWRLPQWQYTSKQSRLNQRQRRK